jgi:hypothetical protein
VSQVIWDLTIVRQAAGRFSAHAQIRSFASVVSLTGSMFAWDRLLTVMACLSMLFLHRHLMYVTLRHPTGQEKGHLPVSSELRTTLRKIQHVDLLVMCSLLLCDIVYLVLAFIVAAAVSGYVDPASSSQTDLRRAYHDLNSAARFLMPAKMRVFEPAAMDSNDTLGLCVASQIDGEDVIQPSAYGSHVWAAPDDPTVLQRFAVMTVRSLQLLGPSRAFSRSCSHHRSQP